MKTRFYAMILLFCAALLVHGAELHTAIARGIGSTSDAALKDALNQAVQQVVGSLVSSEVFMKNDELIKEQVLTYSDGFVQKYEVLKPARVNAGGLVEITIKAFVVQKVLQKRLEAVNIITVKVEGAKNIWAQLETENFRKENAEVLLIKTLSLLNPVDYLDVTLVDKNGNIGSKAQLNIIPTSDASRVKISMGAIVSVNHKKFVKEVQPVLKDVLEKLCIEKTPPVVATDTAKPQKFGFIVDDGVLKERNHGELHIIAGEAAARLRSIKSKQNMFEFALNISKRYNVEQQKFIHYYFPRTELLRKYLDRYKQGYNLLTFILKDQDGEEITRYSQKVFNYQDHPIFFSRYGDEYMISPEISRGTFQLAGVRQFAITFEMKQSDVKDIHSMELILEKRK